MTSYYEEQVNILKEGFDEKSEYKLNIDGKIIFGLIALCFLGLIIVEVI